MARLKEGFSGLLLGLALLNGVASRRVNTTIYDTNVAHITYTPQEDFCVRWSNYIFWRTCDAWAKPWELGVYRSQGKLATLHRSLDHEQPTMTIVFQGSAIWLYGPPRSQLSAIPVDHKVCLHENHRVAPDVVCYRVDVAEAYSASVDFNAPVVIFAKGGLQDQEHRVVVSVGDPIGEVDRHRGIQFSHAVYTIDRPTPWPTEEDRWRFREVVMHDTHPLLSYWPKEPVSPGWWPWSPDPSGWFNRIYTTEGGCRVSWHELQSRGESNQDEWGIDATVTAGAVAIYGVPKAYIVGTDALSDACVRINSGPCEIIDVKHAYLNTEYRHEAVLLWQHQALDSYQQTRISVRLVKTSDSKLRVFPFKELHYFERQEYSSPDPPVGRLENIAVAHDNQAIVYHPGRRCVNHFAWWCTKWFDPWTWKAAGPSGAVLTYRSTVSSYRMSEDPSITLDFQGSAVYVYGAPKSFISDGFASQRVCINDVCHIVDVEQAHLNAPEAPVEQASVSSLQFSNTSNVTMLPPIHPELEPVLIWSMTGLDDQVEHTLRLALAGLPSEDTAEMTIARVVYTKVTYAPGHPRPDTPVPPPDRTYRGPVYPPHAIEWAPRLPPSHPTPDHPQRPLPRPPTPTQPPRHNPPIGESSILPYILWPLFGTIVFFFVLLFLIALCSSATDPEREREREREPIRPRTPPPPYVPGLPPRSAPVPPRPKPPPPRANPPPTRPKSASPPEDSAPGHSVPNPAGPSGHSNSNDRKSNNPLPRSNLPSGVERIEAPPNAPKKSETAKSSLQVQNNPGPCPGSNVAPQRPEYIDNPQKQPLTPSQKSPSSPSKALDTTQNAATHLPPSRHNAASPIPDYRSDRSTSQATSSSAFTPTPNRTSSTVHNVAPPSRILVDNVARQLQPSHTVRPVPQVPPKPTSSSSTTRLPVRTTSTIDNVTTRPERAAQPVASSTTPSIHTSAQAAQSTPQDLTNDQIRSQATTNMLSRPGLPPQEHAYTPALTQWAQGQGFRIDRLMDAAARNDHTRPRTRVKRNQGQTRDAMPAFNPTADDTVDPGNAGWREWRRTVEETGRVPSANPHANPGVAPTNRREQGRREPEGEAPAAGGMGARRSRTNNRRSNQGRNINGQR